MIVKFFISLTRFLIPYKNFNRYHFKQGYISFKTDICKTLIRFKELNPMNHNHKTK